MKHRSDEPPGKLHRSAFPFSFPHVLHTPPRVGHTRRKIRPPDTDAIEPRTFGSPMPERGLVDLNSLPAHGINAAARTRQIVLVPEPRMSRMLQNAANTPDIAQSVSSAIGRLLRRPREPRPRAARGMGHNRPRPIIKISVPVRSPHVETKAPIFGLARSNIQRGDVCHASTAERQRGRRYHQPNQSGSGDRRIGTRRGKTTLRTRNRSWTTRGRMPTVITSHPP